MEALEILFTASLWAAAIRIASPLIFGTLGELICERAGVLNLGIEGIMTAGAFSGWLAVYLGGSLWLGVVVAALVGALFGLLHAMLVVPLGLSQHVTGIGVTLLASSLSYYTYRLVFPAVTSPPKIEITRSATAWRRFSLAATTSSIIETGVPQSRANATNARVSLGKHDPPKPGPGAK